MIGGEEFLEKGNTSLPSDSKFVCEAVSLLEQQYIFMHNTFRNQLVRGLPAGIAYWQC